MMPARLYGSHSLEAYGYRLRCFKDGFGKTTDWKEWSPEMQEYCKKDVVILAKLWTHFQKYAESVVLEHQIAELMAEQKDHRLAI